MIIQVDTDTGPEPHIGQLVPDTGETMAIVICADTDYARKLSVTHIKSGCCLRMFHLPSKGGLLAAKLATAEQFARELWQEMSAAERIEFAAAERTTLGTSNAANWRRMSKWRDEWQPH